MCVYNCSILALEYIYLLMTMSFIYQLLGYCTYNIALVLCGLHFQAFELSFCKPPSSVAMCSISLKVFIKDLYQKSASDKIGIHFYFEWSQAKCKSQ